MSKSFLEICTENEAFKNPVKFLTIKNMITFAVLQF